MLKRTAKAAPTPQELQDKLRAAQTAHSVAITDANMRLAEDTDSVINTAADRAELLTVQIELLTVERAELNEVADQADALQTARL
jgi:hypothetical protein